MYRQITKFLPVVLLLSTLASPLLAQDWAGAERAQGVVLDVHDDPIQGATVVLRYELSPEGGPKPLTTNKKGRWALLGLKPGGWLIEVTAEGYITREEQFTVYDAGANETVKINLSEVPAAVKEAKLRDEANELIQSGNQLLSERRFAESRTTFEQVLGLIPENEHPPILAGIAQGYFQDGKDDEGNKVVDRALAIDPNEELAVRLKIAALAAQGKEAEAQEYMARLPEDTELDPNAELNLGILRYNEGDLEAAGEIFVRVRDTHPDIPEAHYFCGLVHLAREENESALVGFREFVRLAPDHEKAGEAQGFVEYLESLLPAEAPPGE